MLVLNLCVHMCMCGCNARRGQKGALDPLKPELHVVVSDLVWMLEIKVGSCQSVGAFDC